MQQNISDESAPADTKSEIMDDLRGRAESALIGSGAEQELSGLLGEISNLHDELKPQLREKRKLARKPGEKGQTAEHQSAKDEVARLRSYRIQLSNLKRKVRDALLERRLQDKLAAKLGSIWRVKALDSLILLLIFVVLGMLVVEFAVVLSPGAQSAFIYVDSVICAIFLFEFFLKLHYAESKAWYFRRNWIDFVASIPLPLIFELFNVFANLSGGSGVVRAGRSIRILRLARLSRFMRVIRAVVFLRKRFIAFVEGRRKELDKDFVLSFDSVRDYLSEVATSKTGNHHVFSRAVHWYLWLTTQFRGAFFLRPFTTIIPVESLEKLDKKSMTAAVAKRLTSVVDRLEGAQRYFCDFNGIVTTVQLLNYVGKALFAAGKRRGIVLLSIGLAGAMFGFFVKALFAPVGVLHTQKIRSEQFADSARFLAAVKWPLLKFGNAKGADEGRFVREYDLEIENRGEKDLTITSVQLRNEDEAFSISPGKPGDELPTPDTPVSLQPQSTWTLALVFDPKDRSTHRNYLIIQNDSDEEIWLDLEGESSSWAQRFASGATRSFGWNFVLISLPFLVIALLGRNWVSKSKRLTEDYKNIAEASFLNLLEDAKRPTMYDDLGFLYDRVFKSEVLMNYGEAAVSDCEESVKQKVDAILAERRAVHLDYEIEDIAYEKLAFPDEDGEGFFTDEELRISRTGFILEAMFAMSRGKPVTSVHNRAAGTVIQLYRDYLDGALFHETDKKTIEQLLGNPTIREISRKLNYSRRDRKELEKLTSPFGPNLWFTFITRSIAQQTGRLVDDYNHSCVPLRLLNKKSGIYADEEVIKEYNAWLDEGKPVSSFALAANEFNAMNFLMADEDHDNRVRETFGEKVYQKMLRDRRRMIQIIFGTYPVKTEFQTNPYQLYRRIFGRTRQDEIQLSRIRRFLGLPKSLFKILIFPFKAILGLYKAIRFTVKWIKAFIVTILADVGEDYKPDYEAALRKIGRMRSPVIKEATKLRTKFDFQYLGCKLPGTNDNSSEDPTYQKDLESIGVSDKELAGYQDERAARESEIPKLDEFLESNGMKVHSPEVLRAIETAYLIDYQRVKTLILAGETIESAFSEAIEKKGKFDDIRLRKRCLTALTRCVKAMIFLGKYRDKRIFNQYLEGSKYPNLSAQDRESCFKAYLANRNGVKDAIDEFVRVDGKCDEAAVEILTPIIETEYDAWTEELTTLRTVHSLGILDMRNYQFAVKKLGGFEEEEIAN